MRLQWPLLWLAALALAEAKWKCSQGQIRRAGGNICCNEAVGKMIKKELGKKRTSARKLSSSIRTKLEKEEDGFWEVVVGKCKYGFANYIIDSYHCKVTQGKHTALAWKVLRGKGRAETKEDSSEEEKETTARKPKPKPTRAPGGGGGGPATTKPKPKPTPKPTTARPRTKRPTTKRPATKRTTRRPTTRPPRRKTPNEKLMECCLKNRIAPSCYDKSGGKSNLCDFNEYNTNSVVTHYLQKTCPPDDMGTILLCASSNTGHNDCCADNGVEIPLCSIFCNAAAGLRAPKPEEFKCANYLNNIKSCFIRYMKYGSSYGRSG